MVKQDWLVWINKQKRKRCKIFVGCGGLSLTLSTSRNLKIKVSRNNSKDVYENDKGQAALKVSVDAGTEFKGSYSTLFQKKIEIYKTYREKKSAFAEKK